ncbi:hypothetical protein NQ318_011464, partial [Aromia moschata]
MKPYKLKDYLRRCHPDKIVKDLKYFQTLKDKIQKRPTVDKMFALTSQRDDDGLRASYNISLLIAKSGKPHTIGEKLILPAIEEVFKLSNTVQRRIDEIERFLCNFCTTYFSIQLDESTLPGNEALLLAHVRFITQVYKIKKSSVFAVRPVISYTCVMDQEIHEDLLFGRTLTTVTKGESIFNVPKCFMEKAIPLSNIISASDGAPARVERYRVFVNHLKQNIPGVLAVPW